MAKVTKQAWLIVQKANPSVTKLFDTSMCNDRWEVLAGPVDVTFDVPDEPRCPHCNGVLPQQETAKLALLPLVVGGVYMTRGGMEKKITHHQMGLMYPFMTDDDDEYTEDGRWFIGESNVADLIERIA